MPFEQQKNRQPPKWANALLSRVCASEFLEEVQGDLHEAFHRRCREIGPHRARLLFIAEVFRSLSAKTMIDSIFATKGLRSLVSNYFTIARRSLLRNKAFSVINIMGLAISMAACFLLLHYVHFEQSYDKFHDNADRIYRVYLEHRSPSLNLLSATNHPGVGPRLKAEFPEVEDYARMLPQSLRMGNMVALSYVDEKDVKKAFYEDHIYIVDPSFLTLFSFPFKLGNPRDALTDATSVVISESVAAKYFGNENPLGKTLSVNKWNWNFKVTGVFKDIPENSHIKFDILMSWWFVGQGNKNDQEEGYWKWAEFYTYIRLAPNVNAKAFEAKLGNFMESHAGDFMKSMNYTETVKLQALNDIHLRSPEMTNEREVHGSERTVYFLLLIAGLILLIAWINYINLSTSKSIERAKEVGLRKVVGAQKRQLVFQFLFESATINFIALLLAFLITFLAYPSFMELTGKDMGPLLQSSLIQQPSFWLRLTAVFLLGSILSGLYPALVISSFGIVNVIKGSFVGLRSGIQLRRVLVGFQFLVSATLIAGTMIIYRQVEYMRNHDPGYTRDQLLVVKGEQQYDSLYFKRNETFKGELLSNPSINGATLTSEVPGALLSQRNSIRKMGQGTEGNTMVYHYSVDNAFASTFGLKVLAGRSFNENERLLGPKAKANPIMLNRKVVETLGYRDPEDAINQLVYFGLGEPDWVGQIVGVVENFNQQSLRIDYEPLIFFPGQYANYITVNVGSGKIQETIGFIENKFKVLFPGSPFDYFFLDDRFNRQYASDLQFGKVFSVFTGLTLVIAVLGLYGLTLFMVSQRTKEMAVRRVLGASVSSLVTLFSKDFVRLILIANVIMLPVVYFLGTRWLDNFAFRISIGWIMFATPAIVLLIISISTISIQTAKTALKNPVKSLRTE